MTGARAGGIYPDPNRIGEFLSTTRVSPAAARERGGGDWCGGGGGASGHCDVVVIKRFFCSWIPASVGKDGHGCEVAGALS